VALADARNKRDAIRDAFAQVWSIWLQHKSLMIAVGDARVSDSEAAAIWQRWFDRFVEAVADSIAADRANGLALSGPEPEHIARLLLEMNERSLQELLRDQRSTKEISERLDAMTAVCVRSICGEG